MKTIFALLLFSVSIFSSAASADSIFTLEGDGTAANAVKAFNKTIAFNRGTVDKNAETEFSSAGDIGQYQAQLYVEDHKGKVNLRVVVKVKKDSIWNVIAVSGEQELAVKIYNKLKEDGYRD